MKNCLLICLVFTLLSCHKRNIDGVYSGLEEMCSIDSTGKKVCYEDEIDPHKKWYHLSILKIRDGKVFMDQSPATIYRNDTSYSSSDGGFYYYSGSVATSNDSIDLNLIQLSCDYCGQRVKTNPDGSLTKVIETKRLSGHIVNDGLLLNNILFKKTKSHKGLLSEHRTMDK
jgi:hypothetical protein